MIDDRERVAVAPVTELELALEVGAPQVVRGNPSGQRRAARTMARPAAPLDQAMAVQHGMDGTFGRNPDVARQPADQQLADLARAPVRLVAFEPDDEGSRAARAAGWRSGPAGASGRSGPQARALCSGRKPCSRSCGRCRTPGTRPSWLPRPAGGRQSAGVPPSPNSLSTASTPPAKRRKVLPMCPVRSVTYVSGRSGRHLATPEYTGIGGISHARSRATQSGRAGTKASPPRRPAGAPPADPIIARAVTKVTGAGRQIGYQRA